MSTVTVRKSFPSYNARRYGRPWGAIVTFINGKPSYDFNAGCFLGTDDGGSVQIQTEMGSVVAFGQKDHRGNGTTNVWFIVTPTGLQETDQQGAFEHATASENNVVFEA